MRDLYQVKKGYELNLVSNAPLEDGTDLGILGWIGRGSNLEIQGSPPFQYPAGTICLFLSTDSAHRISYFFIDGRTVWINYKDLKYLIPIRENES